MHSLPLSFVLYAQPSLSNLVSLFLLCIPKSTASTVCSFHICTASFIIVSESIKILSVASNMQYMDRLMTLTLRLRQAKFIYLFINGLHNNFQ
jgi:hypothetical protein